MHLYLWWYSRFPWANVTNKRNAGWRKEYEKFTGKEDNFPLGNSQEQKFHSNPTLHNYIESNMKMLSVASHKHASRTAWPPHPKSNSVSDCKMFWIQYMSTKYRLPIKSELEGRIPLGWSLLYFVCSAYFKGFIPGQSRNVLFYPFGHIIVVCSV